MELAIQKLAIVFFFVIGLSHIFQSRVWAQFFIDLRSKGETGSFIIGFINLNLGALVVAFHNVWHGVPIILTIAGYAWVLKSLIYFVFPKRGLKTLSRVTLERSWEFIAAGIVLVGMGGLLLFSLCNAGHHDTKVVNRFDARVVKMSCTFPIRNLVEAT